MIALLAALPAETNLIRHALEDCVQDSIKGLTLITGNYSGTNILLAHSGIGKAAAAATAITLLSSCQPEALWLFGCGGAYPGSGLSVGDLALASAEIFGDEGVSTAAGFRDFADMRLPMRHSPKQFFNTWPVDIHLHDWAQPHLAEQAQKTGSTFCCGPFVTVSTCTGETLKAEEIAERTAGICENMEGAAVALACQQLAVPLLEVRGISNLVENRDTRRWDLPLGMTAAQRAIMALLQAWPKRQL